MVPNAVLLAALLLPPPPGEDLSHLGRFPAMREQMSVVYHFSEPCLESPLTPFGRGIFELNYAFRKGMRIRRESYLDSQEASQAVRRADLEAEALLAAWEALDAACCEENGPGERRLSLGRLRRMLGEDAWWAGQMPYPVPYHALSEIP